MRYLLKWLLKKELRYHTQELHDSDDCVFCHMSLECLAHWVEGHW